MSADKKASLSIQRLDFPLPPHNMSSEVNNVTVSDPVIVFLLNGKRINASLRTIDYQRRLIHLNLVKEEIVRVVEFSEIKLLILPTIRKLSPAKTELGEQVYNSNTTEPPRFIVTFKDDDVLEGITFGHKPGPAGIHLFSRQDAESYINIFVPHQAIKRYRIGRKVGEVLLQEQLVDEDQINEALETQKEQRSKPIGEYLRTSAVVTATELEKALERQKQAPNLRLGEVLVAEGLITPEQLEKALESQKEDRNRPLGEVLIQKGYVSAADIQNALARKNGIPFVDLQKFDISPDVLRLVPEELARQYSFVPLYIYDHKLVIAMENPLEWVVTEAVSFHCNIGVEAVIAPKEDVLRAINFGYFMLSMDELEEEEQERGAEPEADTGELEDSGISENAVVKIVNKIIISAYQQNASDIHIEPYPGTNNTQVRIRKDGSLVRHLAVPHEMRRSVTSRIKVMARLDIANVRTPQDGKIDFKRFARLPIELRVATVPTVGGHEDVVLRILAAGKPLPVEKLGLSEHNQALLLDTTSKPYGLFLVCGPTGSGKTTTLHAVLALLNKQDAKIWTVEDPVEITQKGLRQVQINPKAGLTFASALRSLLRADPDIIMVGEMRDEETTKIGIEASLTGHLVLSTLHTNNAPESIVRLLEMGIDPFTFEDALLGILAQRLTKSLCENCKESYDVHEEELLELAAQYQMDAGIDASPEQLVAEWRQRYADDRGVIRLYKARGCTLCDSTGYRNRIALHELLVNSDRIKKLISSGKTVNEIRRVAVAEGMRTLKQDGIEKVLSGITDIHQIRRVCAR